MTSSAGRCLSNSWPRLMRSWVAVAVPLPVAGGLPQTEEEVAQETRLQNRPQKDSKSVKPRTVNAPRESRHR